MGANTALEFARAGFDVALTARNQGRLDAVAGAIEALGSAAFAHASDLTDRESMAAFADAATDRFERCDVVCNIGIYQGEGMSDLFMETSLDAFATHYQADVISPAYLSQRAIPLMLEQGGGTIVNMSSSSVVREPPGNVHQNGWSLAYVAAKAGIDRFASILNVELGGRGIRAFNVEPGFVAYEDVLAEKLAKYPGVPVSPPEAIGPAIVWLVQSPDADRFLPKRVSLPGLTHKLGLLEHWGGPGTLYPSPGT